MFANETAKSIFQPANEPKKGDDPKDWVDLKLKKFTALDLQEDRNPLLDELSVDDKSPLPGQVPVGNKVSLSTIAKGLANNGDHRFAESTIYKVSIPKRVKERAQEEGLTLTTHVMVEAALNQFGGTAAVTIFLRDVTDHV